MPTPPSRPPRANVPDNIIDNLRTRILRGELSPGERLAPERELAKQYGTNRTSLREALRALEAQGLLRARQGDGVRVQNFRQWGDISLLPHYFAAADPAQRIDIFGHLLRLRSLLIPEVIRLCIAHGSDEQLAHLDRLVDDLAAAESRQDLGGIATAELALYRSIVESSGALTYIWVFNSLERVVRGFIASQPNMWLFVPNLVELWGSIVGAIQGRNNEEAALRFGALLKTIEDQVTQLLPLFRASTES